MPLARTLIDTGPLVAVLSKRDEYHQRCVDAFRDAPAPLLTCWPVLTETAYMLGETTPAFGKLCDLLHSRDLVILPLGLADLPDIAAILRQYRDQKFQLADASLMHLATREKLDRVLSLDRKDFSLFRKPDGSRLVILPEQ